MAEIQADPAPVHVQAAPDAAVEKPAKRKTIRFGSLRKRLSMDNNGNVATLEAKNAELQSKNAELEALIQKLRSQLASSSEAKSELQVRCDTLVSSSESLAGRVKELSAENEDLKEQLTGANSKLEVSQEDLSKAKAEVTALDAKLAKAKRPIFGFGSKSLREKSAVPPLTMPGGSVVSPRGSFVSPRHHNSMDASESWYGRFCGQPSDLRTNSTSTARDTPRGHDSVDSWYGRFCGLTEEE